MRKLFRRKASQHFVLIVYPIVSSLGRDNLGGFSHLLANIEVYKNLGFKVICLTRSANIIFENKNGIWFFNVIPGKKNPNIKSPTILPGQSFLKVLTYKAFIKIRNSLLNLIANTLILFFTPTIVHQRANSRFMLEPKSTGAIYLTEFNDSFENNLDCDGYLSILERPNIHRPALINPWPVIGNTTQNLDAYKSKIMDFCRCEHVNVVLYGDGGIVDYLEIQQFVENHKWLRGRPFTLHVYGPNVPDFDNVEFHPPIEELSCSLNTYDIGLIFYSKKIYGEDRIRQGSPTKFYKYVDAQLPIFSNREYISKHYLNCADSSTDIFNDENILQSYINNLAAKRNEASIPVYAKKLYALIASIR
ncbi:hypothetical protein OAC13_01645 [bacterium]|nr:hypothetical protein [bacterium]